MNVRAKLFASKDRDLPAFVRVRRENVHREIKPLARRVAANRCRPNHERGEAGRLLLQEDRPRHIALYLL